MHLIPAAQRQRRLQRFIESRSPRLERLRQRRLTLGLSVMALLGGSQVFTGLYLELLSMGVLLPVYIVFVLRSRKERDFHHKLQLLLEFYTRKGALENETALESPSIDSFPDPDIVRDLDLHELFPYINESTSVQGETDLKSWLCGQNLSTSVKDKHTGLLTLSKFPGPLRRLQMLFPRTKIDLEEIQQTAALPLATHPPLWRWALPILWILGIASIFALPPLWTKLLFLAYCALTLIYLIQTGSSFSRVQGLLKDLERLEPLFLQISKWASSQVPGLEALTSKAPHRTLRRFRRSVSLMSVQGNPLIFYLLNFACPWSLLVREWSENQRKQLAQQFPSWQKEILYFDVMGSLASVYLYLTQTLPSVDKDNGLQVSELRHPLIAPTKIVTNDFDQKDKRIFLITGSNMSGKSTFLRALGMNYCLAQMGAPIFAAKMNVPLSPIRSCIRVSDSLRDGQSYFYAEVRRLKSILEAAKKEPVVFLVDEPLRGTNNKERLDGNSAYLKQLVATNSLGFISTHDLEMTDLEHHVPELSNYHFTDIWKDQALYFDYKIRTGPSETTNALKIMAKEGLLTLPENGAAPTAF